VVGFHWELILRVAIRFNRPLDLQKSFSAAHPALKRLMAELQIGHQRDMP